MLTDKETYKILSAINDMDESRVGGWIHNCKINISVSVLVELMNKKLMEAGGMYSRLTKRGTAFIN